MLSFFDVKYCVVFFVYEGIEGLESYFFYLGILIILFFFVFGEMVRIIFFFFVFMDFFLVVENVIIKVR